MGEWYVRLPKGIAGPFTEKRLRKLLAEGMVEPGTPVRLGEEGKWQPLGSVVSIGAKSDQSSKPRKPAGGENRQLMIGAAAGVGLAVAVAIAFVFGRGGREEPVATKPAAGQAPVAFNPPVPQSVAPTAPAVPDQAATSPVDSAGPQPTAEQQITSIGAKSTPAVVMSPVAPMAARPPVAEVPAQPAPPGDPDEPKDIKDLELTSVIDRLSLELTPERGLARIAEIRKKFLLTDKQKSRIDTEEAKWKDRQEKGVVRLGNRWVKPEDQRDGEEKAQRLVRQAIPLLMVGSFKETLNFLEDASKSDGNGIEAEFLLGLLRSIDRSPLLDADVAERHFEEVLKRSPDNLPALNNLGVAELKQKKYPQAVQHLSRASLLAPKCQEVAQNIGRVLYLAGQKRIRLDAKEERAFAESYAVMIAEGKGKEADVRRGYLLMPMVLPKRERVPDDLGERVLAIHGSGTGFAVGPGLVLTNRHVVKNDEFGVADEIRIAVSKEGQPITNLKGKIVAISGDADLALLTFNGLDAEPLSLRKKTPRLGEEIAIVGFPRPDQLGNDLKFAKGSVNAVRPDELLFDCVANQGNSGGPVLATDGQVAGIYTFVRMVGIDVRTSHGGAVPAERATDFLIPHLPPADHPVEIKESDWPTTVERVRNSIFKIDTFYFAGSESLHATAKGAKATASTIYEDHTCPNCSGRGALPCPGQCVKGSVKVTWTEQGRGVVLGREVSVPVIKSRVDTCSVCRGQGAIDCPMCIRGFDKALSTR